VRLPVAPTARSLAIGDVVSLTATPWVWDSAANTAGVTGKTAMVTGWSRPEGYNSDDRTDVDHFEADDQIKIVLAGGPAFTAYVATIAAVTATTADAVIEVAAMPAGLTTAMMPAYVTFDLYTTCTTDQASEGWCWIADDADGQVLDARVGWKWGA
jgi:hypothetical protein